MGFLFYGSDDYAIEIGDRTLAHLKVAILSLLRANISVALSFSRTIQEGSGRDTLWITPTTDLRFHFNGNRPPRINEPWVRAIIATASTPTGMQIVLEQDIPIPAPAAMHV